MKRGAFLYALLLFFIWPLEAFAQCVVPQRLEYVSDSFLGHTIEGAFIFEGTAAGVSGARLKLEVSGPLKNATYEYTSEMFLAPDNTFRSRLFRIRTTRSDDKTEVKEYIPRSGEGDPLTVALNMMTGRYGPMNPGGERSIPVVQLRDRDASSREVRMQMGTADDALWYRAKDNPGARDSVFLVTLPSGLYGNIVREMRMWLNSCGIPTVAVIEFVTLRLKQ
ncbi:MAG: hypothetical protein HY455_00670 [Parcubacteria group bacterium]|nr:hypothetical protein [Parcubacteria group bacterium]